MSHPTVLIFGNNDFGRVNVAGFVDETIRLEYPVLYFKLKHPSIQLEQLQMTNYSGLVQLRMVNNHFVSGQHVGKVVVPKIYHTYKTEEYLAVTDMVSVDNAKMILDTSNKIGTTILEVKNKSAVIIMSKSHVTISIEKNLVIATKENEHTVITDTNALVRLVNIVSNVATVVENNQTFKCDQFYSLRLFKKFFNDREVSFSEVDSNNHYINPLKQLLEKLGLNDIGYCVNNLIDDNIFKVIGAGQDLESSRFGILPQEIVQHIGSYIDIDSIDFK